MIIGYCCADAVYMLAFEYDVVMLGHHVAVVIGVIPMVFAPYGFMIVVISTFLAEITNPVQNTWQYARDYGPKSRYQKLSTLFTISFSLVRGIIMPLMLIDFAVFLFIE